MEPNEQNSGVNQQILRLIDANVNRGREGIRTAEDYIRFTVGQGVWAARLKIIRHGLTGTINRHFALRDLVCSRNVGTDPLRPESNEPPPSSHGDDARTVALRGLKRAQEALRVLEEFCRSAYPAASVDLSQCRYACYEAEQWLIAVSPAMQVVSAAPVYVLLTERLCSKGLFETTREILKGGIRVLQVREKEVSHRANFTRVHDLLKLIHEYGAVLICNDDPALALASEADGVHLGQDDLPPLAVRKVVGQKLIVGRSTHSAEQALKAVNEEGVDYVAIGSMYDTTTKPERQLVGPALAEQVSALNLGVPVFAIGGITRERIPELKQAGVKQFAVSSAIISAADPQDAAKRMIDAACS